ncbi:MAG: caspase family protein [Candidatus Electrothrix scaldis]|nr:MAG: caspase family protein [Candidatus Electrothrix sp. GW3-3]
MVNRYIIVTVLLLLIAAPVQAIDPSRYFGKSYAVVIGIRNYPTHWDALEYAEKDAKAMAELLEKQGFEVRRFIGREATRNNIVSYLEDDLATRLTTNDRIIFYFSGHGATKERGGKNFGYIIPYEGTDRSATWISMEKLRELAQKLGYAHHQLFIFDSCFGGLFATKGHMNSEPEDTPNYIGEMAKHRARQYLTAGGAGEQTPAGSQLPGYREHSHYTAYLLKGLEGAADTYRDGVITASELDAYLGPAATSNMNKPRGDSFAGHEQGNFLFRSPLPATTRGGTIFTSQTKGFQSGRNEDRREVERLQAEIERLERLRAEERSRPKSYTPESYTKPVAVKNTLSKEDQAQALYEWQHDIQGSASSYTVEQFLKLYPVGSHVPAAQKKLNELRARGQ